MDIKKVNKSDIVETWTEEKCFKKIELYESEFTMDKVLEPLRFVKYTMKYAIKNIRMKYRIDLINLVK